VKYTEGTQTEEGSKWLKKQKRRRKVEGKRVIKGEYQGRQSSKEDELWTGQQVEEDTNRFFGEPHRVEGRIGWRSSEKAGYMDLGFWYMGFWYLGFNT
jgi:hypothetical protein